MIRQIVGAASIRAAVIVGGNAPLTSGKENGTINASWNVREVKNGIQLILALIAGGNDKYQL